MSLVEQVNGNCNFFFRLRAGRKGRERDGKRKQEQQQKNEDEDGGMPCDKGRKESRKNLLKPYFREREREREREICLCV